MKFRIFYLVCVYFGLACCGVVPSNFKSSEDEHMHGEDIFASNGTNASIPILENSESNNSLSSDLLDLHHLKISEELVFDFQNVSNLSHVQDTVPEEDHTATKLLKGSVRSKKKSPKDSSRFRNPPQEPTDHAGINSTLSHGLVDHTSDPHHLHAENKTKDLKINGSVDDHSSGPHHLQTGHEIEDLKSDSSVDDHSSKPHLLQTDHKAGDSKSHGSVKNHSLEPDHLQTDNKTKDLKFHESVDDHSSEFSHPQTDHKSEDFKSHGSVVDHSSELNHLQTDHKTDNLEFHDSVEQPSSGQDHAFEDFPQTDKNVSKGLDHVENITSHSDEEPERLKDFATKSEAIILKSPDHELKKVETEFITQAIGFENHSEDAKHDANTLNKDFSNGSIISHSNDLINISKDLIRDSNNISQEINDSIINNLSDFSNVIEDFAHDSNQISKDSLNDSVSTHTSDLINPVLKVTHDSSRANKDNVNDSVVSLFNDLTKPVNEAQKNVSENLKSELRTTSEIKNDSHVSPKITEATQEHFNGPESTNNVFKNTVASITNSKLFMNIHNSFMRLNPTEKFNPAQLSQEDKTSENVLSISEDLTASKINGENSNKNSDMDTISQEVNMSIKELPVTESKNEDKLSSRHSAEILVEPKINNKLESIDIEKKAVNVVENNTAQGLFSSLGFDFLMNSELAKNAASAMDVFNFTDSALTDHIIDDQNDMHDLLDIRSLVVDDHSLSNSKSTEQSNVIVDTDSSTLVTDTPKLDTESSRLDLEINDGSVNNKLKNETFIKENGSSSELSGRNGSIEALTPKPSRIALNTTEDLDTVAVVSTTIIINSTVEFEVTPSPAQHEYRNASEIVKEVECPPPGICIFWFFAQDTCTVNSHCLGSRICCRIGCSKTCVEI